MKKSTSSNNNAGVAALGSGQQYTSGGSVGVSKKASPRSNFIQ